MLETAQIDKPKLRNLHELMKFLCHVNTLGKQLGIPASQDITGQAIFNDFREILKEIPTLYSDENFKHFETRYQGLLGSSSMQSMAKAIQSDVELQYAVDQVLHNPDKIKRHLLKATEDTLSLEALAPMINMLSLTASAAVDREAIVDFDKNSGNVFGLARHEGGGAEVSARGKRAVEKRLAQNSTKSIKDKVELEWAKALKAPSSDNGMKTHFAKRMVQQLKEDNAKQMKKDHQQIVVSEETILDWMMRWGGTLNKVARPKKPRRAAKS